MTRARMALALTCCLLIVTSHSVKADVRADEKSRLEFGGMLGKMMNLFGGKAAREGVTSIVAVKGDRKATLSDQTGQIIDLNEEKIYDLDLKRKTYKVTTFAELRRQMEEARRKAAEDAHKQPAQKKGKPSEAPAPDKKQTELEIDFDLKETGQKKTINGFDTHEIVMIVSVREKGKTLEQSGGIVLTSNMWMTSKVAAMTEIADFDLRYARKLQGPMVAGASAEQMAMALAMYPGMKDAIGRMNVENVKMDGTAIQTTVKIDGVKSADEMKEERQRQQEGDQDDKSGASGGVGGILGGFAKRMAQKKAAGGQNEQPNRASIMTMTNEVVKVTTDVAASDVGIPAGFKEGG